MPPMAKKGPNGTAIFMDLRVFSIMSIPETVPTADATNMVNRTPFQPIMAPIMPKSLMSPPPIPSFLVSK